MCAGYYTTDTYTIGGMAGLKEKKPVMYDALKKMEKDVKHLNVDNLIERCKLASLLASFCEEEEEGCE